MTVGELRALLGFFKESEPVHITSDDGYGWIDIGGVFRSPIGQIANEGLIV